MAVTQGQADGHRSGNRLAAILIALIEVVVGPVDKQNGTLVEGIVDEQIGSPMAQAAPA